MMRANIGCLLLLPSLAASTAAVDAKGTVLLTVRSQLGRLRAPEVGQRDWEDFAGSDAPNPRSVACRGRQWWDSKASYYEVHKIFSEEACKELCLADQPRCKGIEYSFGRCEIWTRKEGIGAVKDYSLPGLESYPPFTCKRYGWPAKYLQPMDGGVGRGCRGDHENDKSRSYFTNYTVWNMEDCKALCVAADICAGLQFNMFNDERQGRCEIWHREIKATKAKPWQTCLRFEPPAVTAVPSTTAPAVTAVPSTTAMPPSTSDSDCEVFVERDSNFCNTCPECGGCDKYCATL